MLRCAHFCHDRSASAHAFDKPNPAPVSDVGKARGEPRYEEGGNPSNHSYVRATKVGHLGVSQCGHLIPSRTLVPCPRHAGRDGSERSDSTPKAQVGRARSTLANKGAAEANSREEAASPTPVAGPESETAEASDASEHTPRPASSSATEMRGEESPTAGAKKGHGGARDGHVGPPREKRGLPETQHEAASPTCNKKTTSTAGAKRRYAA